MLDTNGRNVTNQSISPVMVVVGELNVDLILEEINQLPEIGKERIAKGMTLTLGSSSAILASNASMLGLDVGFIGRIGRDAFGELALRSLQDSRVDTRHIIETEGLTTGVTTIFTHRNDRGMLTYPGAMESLVLDDIPWDYLHQAKHLHLSSYYLQSGLRPSCKELFRRAKQLGLSTSLDTNWDPEEKWGKDVLDVLPYIDIFLPNDHEARLISGKNDLDAALEFLSQRAGIVVATCGAEGVRAQQGDQKLSLPGLPVRPVDAVGAGDSFNAGFLNRYLGGEKLEDCLHYGLLTGAFSTLGSGGTSAFRDRDHFRRFSREMNAH
ncbi:MAG: carbohydrate kinase family protein [Balneolales bacterium]